VGNKVPVALSTMENMTNDNQQNVLERNKIY